MSRTRHTSVHGESANHEPPAAAGCFGCLRRRDNKHLTRRTDVGQQQHRSHDDTRSVSTVSSCSITIGSARTTRREAVPIKFDTVTTSNLQGGLPNTNGHKKAQIPQQPIASLTPHMPIDYVAGSRPKESFCDDPVDMSDDEYYSQEKDVIMDQMTAERYKIQLQQSRQSDILRQRISEYQSTGQKMETVMRQADVNNRLQKANRERQVRLMKGRLDDRKRRIQFKQKVTPDDAHKVIGNNNGTSDNPQPP